MAIPITRAEYQSKFGQQPPQPTQGKPIPITRAEYQAKFGQQPPQQPTEISIEAPRGGGMESIDQWHQEQTDKLMRAYQSGQISGEKMHEINQQLLQEAQGSTDREKPILLRAAEATEERIEKGKEADVAGMKGEQTFFESGAQIAGQMAGWFGDMGALVVSEAIPESVKEGGEDAIASFMETEAGQQVAEKAQEVQKWAEENPRAARNLAAAGNLLSIVPTTGGAGAGVKVGTRAAREAGELGLDVAELGARSARGAMRATGSAAEKAGTGTRALGRELTSRATGLNKETIDQVIKNPELFSQSEMAKISDEALFNKARTAIDQRLSALDETGKAYEGIRRIEQPVNIEEDFVGNAIRNAGFDVQDGQVIATTKSASRQPADINALQRFMDDWGGRTELTPEEFLNMRKDLSELSKFDRMSGKTRASEQVAKKMRNSLNEYRDQIPGLKQLDKKFGPEKEFLEKVKKDFFNRDGTLKSNAVSKMANLTGRGKEQVLDRMEKIVPGITEEVNILKAVQDISRAGEQKVGTYAQSIAGLGVGAATGGVPGAIIGAIATSPAVTVRILRAYATAMNKGKGAIGAIINKMKKGRDLTKGQKDTVREALRFAGEKLVRDGDFEPRSGLLRRAKEGKISAGMSMRDVSEGGLMRPQAKRAAAEAKLMEDDRNALKDFINAVRSDDKDYLAQERLPAEYIFEKLGVNMDMSLGRLANVAESILTGAKSPRPLYATGRPFEAERALIR
jgi:hypothetical protein